MKGAAVACAVAALSLLAALEVARAETPLSDTETGAKVLSLLDGQWMTFGEYDRWVPDVGMFMRFDGHGNITLGIGHSDLGGKGTYAISQDKLVIRADKLEAGWVWGREVATCDVAFRDEDNVVIKGCIGTGQMRGPGGRIYHSQPPEALSDLTLLADVGLKPTLAADDAVAIVGCWHRVLSVTDDDVMGRSEASVEGGHTACLSSEGKVDSEVYYPGSPGEPGHAGLTSGTYSVSDGVLHVSSADGGDAWAFGQQDTSCKIDFADADTLILTDCHGHDDYPAWVQTEMVFVRY